MSAKKTVLAALLLGSFGVAMAAGIEGDSSNVNLVEPGLSDLIPFGGGKPGLKFYNAETGTLSTSINLENGPIKHIRIKHGSSYHWLTGNETGTPTAINGNNANANVDGTQNAKYLKASDVNPVMGWFITDPLGQVWYEKRANNTEVYSVRQMAELSGGGIQAMAPRFGGLVMAKVPNLPADTAVYFGEWAPRADGAMVQNSTDLNMNSDQRTVWYVGENPTSNMPTLVNAQYDVLGVNKHVPGQNDFYSGVLTANYGTSSGNLSGNISRGSDVIDFAGTKVYSGGNFSNTNNPSNTIRGQFYGNGAEALAGIVNRDGVANDVAFGGKKR